MGEGLLRFKRENLVNALVKAVLVFLSVALLVVATFLLVAWLTDGDVNLVLPIVIGVGAGLLLGALTFYIFFLSERRLVKSLDKRFSSREKIQTMYAFREEEGGLIELQRSEAQMVLYSRPTKSFGKLLLGWLGYIIVLVLSVAYLTVSIVLLNTNDSQTNGTNDGTDNGDKEEPPVVEDFEATDYQKKALEALIEYVEASKLQDDAKQAVVTELTLLLVNMDTLGTDTNMRDYVVGVIKNVRGIVNTVNSTFAFHMAAGDSLNENMNNFSLAIYSLDLNAIEAQLDYLRNNLYASGTTDEIESFNDELSAVLSNAAFSKDTSEALYVIISQLANTMQDILDHPDYSESNINRKLDTALLTTALDGLKQIIPVQKNNEDVKVYVVEELKRIFGITEEDLSDRKDENGTPETEEPEERPELGDDGGFGTGETIFGSNDIVIDPTKDPGSDIDSINVQYGEIIYKNGYTQKITDLIVNGDLSEDLIEILEKYFEILETPSEN